jgi:hypothetical protein
VIVQSPLGTELDRISLVQQHLPGVVAVLLGLLALGAAAIPGLWRLTVHVNTIAHEGMHATVASALGWKVSSVRLARNGTGKTLALGRANDKTGTFLFQLLGYVGPSAFGLFAAKLIQIGHSVAALWLAMLLLVCMLFVVRGVFGALTIIAATVGLFLLLVYGSVGAQVATAYAITWFLLLSGVRAVMEDGAKAEDAGELRSLTLLPRGVWSFLWLIASICALGLGAVLLV